MIKVPFAPDKSRPVYCKSCLKKVGEEKQAPVSLKEIPKLTSIPFSGEKISTEKPKRLQPTHYPKKKVDLKELKEVLKNALKKTKP